MIKQLKEALQFTGLTANSFMTINVERCVAILDNGYKVQFTQWTYIDFIRLYKRNINGCWRPFVCVESKSITEAIVHLRKYMT